MAQEIPGLLSAFIRRLASDGETAEVEIHWRRGADTARAWREHQDAILLAAGLLPAAWQAADGWETACGSQVVEIVTARRVA